MKLTLRNSCLATLLVGLLFLAYTSFSQSEGGQTLRVRRFVAPAYPAMARIGRIQGRADVNLGINADGTIASVTVTAHPVFRGYVEKALKQWQFEPLTAPATLNVVVNFEIENCPDAKPNELGAAQVRETRVTADLPGNIHVATCTDFITVTTSDPVSR